MAINTRQERAKTMHTQQNIIKASQTGLEKLGLVEKDGQLWTNTLKVADYFEKRHKNVLRASRELGDKCSGEFYRSNFIPASYSDDQGKLRPMIQVTRSGLMMLIMAFTGKRAVELKVKCISAFALMEKKILEAIEESETDIFQTFVKYAKGQGYQHADDYTDRIKRVMYEGLGAIEPGQAIPADLESSMVGQQAHFLGTLGYLCQKVIRSGIEDARDHESIFNAVKEVIQRTVASLGGKEVIAR